VEWLARASSLSCGLEIRAAGPVGEPFASPLAAQGVPRRRKGKLSSVVPGDVRQKGQHCLYWVCFDYGKLLGAEIRRVLGIIRKYLLIVKKGVVSPALATSSWSIACKEVQVN
jgi:hypothetical protein